MNSLRVELRSILDAVGSSIEIDEKIDLEPVVVGDEIYTPTEPAALRVTLANTGHEVVAYGTVEMRSLATCVRCLCDFELAVEAEVSGFYIKPGAEQTVPEEQEFSYISPDEEIDLMPAIVEALVLEVPFAPVHDPECKGLCPTCGVDLNVETCACSNQTVPGHPFSALESLAAELEKKEHES